MQKIFLNESAIVQIIDDVSLSIVLFVPISLRRALKGIAIFKLLSIEIFLDFSRYLIHFQNNVEIGP